MGGSSLTVDFSGTEDYEPVPEGSYLVKVAKIEKKVSEKSDKPYLNWQLKIVKGEEKGKTLYHITSLQPQALFNLRDTLTALGFKVPKKALKLDTEKLVGKKMGVAVEEDEYKGRIQAKVRSVFLASKLEDEEEDEALEDEDEDEEDDLDLDEL